MSKELDILVDEMRKAELVSKDEYSNGYYEGLAMAVSIMEGLTD